MREVDALLERFPGPVTLHMSRLRMLIGLTIHIGFAAFFIWLLLSADYAGTRGYIYSGYSLIMAWISLFFFAGLAIRVLLLFLVPGAARLTLDADGFEIAHVFRRVRHSWQDVSDVRAETAHLPGRVGGSFEQIKYDFRTERQGFATREILPIYGLSKDGFIKLMNAWRARALNCRDDLPRQRT